MNSVLLSTAVFCRATVNIFCYITDRVPSYIFLFIYIVIGSQAPKIVLQSIFSLAINYFIRLLPDYCIAAFKNYSLFLILPNFFKFSA